MLSQLPIFQAVFVIFVTILIGRRLAYWAEVSKVYFLKSWLLLNRKSSFVRRAMPVSPALVFAYAAQGCSLGLSLREEQKYSCQFRGAD